MLNYLLQFSFGILLLIGFIITFFGMISGVSKDMKYFLIVKPNCSDLPTLSGFHQSDPMLIECVQKLILPSSVSHEPKRLKTQPHFWSQYTMDKELLKLFNQTLNGIFLDIGAGGATQRSNTRLLEEHLGWTGLLVEPDPAQVQQLISQKRNVSILQMGVARGQYSEMAKVKLIDHIQNLQCKSDVSDILNMVNAINN